MQAEAQPAMASGNRQPGDYHRPGPDSQENKLLLLDTYESIKELIKMLHLIAFSAHFYFKTAFSQVQGNIPPEEWAKLYDDLCNVEREFEQMVGLLRLNQSLLFEIYHRLTAIREAWLAYRDHDEMQSEIRREPSAVTLQSSAENATSMTDSENLMERDKVLLDEVSNRVKRLLVAAR